MPPMNSQMVEGKTVGSRLHNTRTPQTGTPVISPTSVVHTSLLSAPKGSGAVPYGNQHIIDIGKSRPASLPASLTCGESWSISPQESEPTRSVRSWAPLPGTPREHSERSHSIDPPIAAGFSYSITRWLAEGTEDSGKVPALCHDWEAQCKHAVTQNLENISASKKRESYRNGDTRFAGGWADDLTTATAADYAQGLEGVATGTQQGSPEGRAKECSGPKVGTGLHLPRSRRR